MFLTEGQEIAVSQFFPSGLLVQKDQSLRLCVDSRELNST